MTTTDHRVALVTDSTCDIPRDIARSHDIIIVPQMLIWGTEELRDHIDISPKEFYERLTRDPVHPSSSQTDIRTFRQLFEELRDAGIQEILLILLSDQFSGTISSARQASELVQGVTVHIVNSMTASMGLGFQVLAAARARAAGGTVADMIAAAEAVRERIHLLLSVETLEYLHRGGRIGGAAKLIGTALQLKPMLEVNARLGRVEPVERTRTRRRAIQRLYEVFCEQVDPARPARIAVMHGNALEDAEALAERVRNDYNLIELIVTSTSPVIGVHTGPGALGLCGYNEPD
ncbi:MAG: DegV family protein [Aggregatilineales bacterium]|mgnify:FL=1